MVIPLYVEINSLIVFNSYYWNHAVMHIWRHYCVQIWMYAFLGLITSVRIDGSLSIYTQLWTWQVPEHCTNIYAQHIHTHTHTPHKCFLYFTDIFSMLLQTLNCQYLHFLCLKAFKMWKKRWNEDIKSWKNVIFHNSNLKSDFRYTMYFTICESLVLKLQWI